MVEFKLKAKFKKDTNHLASTSNECKITFNKTTPVLNVSIPNGTYVAGSSFNIIVQPKNPDGTDIYIPTLPIQFYINNSLVKSDNTSQEGYSGSLKVPSGATGSIDIKVVLGADKLGYYNAATKTIQLALGAPSGTSVDTVMTLSADKQNVEVGSNVTLTATLKTKSGTPLANRQITFKKGGTSLDVVYTNNNGVATKKIAISSKGTYSFNAVFDGEANNYKSSSANCVVSGVVTTIQPTLTMISGTSIYKGWSLKLLYSAQGTPLAEKTVNITINGVTYQRNTNSEGVASLKINLGENKYSFSANVPANGKYLSCSLTGTVQTISPIVVERRPGCISFDAASSPRKSWDTSKIYNDSDPYFGAGDEYYVSSGDIASKVGTWNGVQDLRNACFGFNIPNGSVIQKLEAVWIHRYNRANSNIDLGAGEVYLDATGQDTIILRGNNNPGAKTWVTNNVSTTDVANVSANALNQNAFQAKIRYNTNQKYNTGQLHLGWLSIKVTYIPPQS